MAAPRSASLLSASRMKRPSLVVYERENEAVNFVLNHSGLTPDGEIVQSLESLPEDKLSHCLECKKTAVLDLVSQYSQDISCSGCVRTLKASLTFPIPEQGLMNALFAEDADGTIRFRSQFRSMSAKDIGKMFTAFNNAAYFSRKGNGKRQRCSLHTAHPRVDEDWLNIWTEMPDHVCQKIALLDVEELSEELTSHLKNLYFCRDCRGNVLRALDLLVGYVEPEDLPEDEEYCEEYFLPFTQRQEIPDEEVDDLVESARRKAALARDPPHAGDEESEDDDSLGCIDDVDEEFPIYTKEYVLDALNEGPAAGRPKDRLSDDSEDSMAGGRGGGATAGADGAQAGAEGGGAARHGRTSRSHGAPDGACNGACKGDHDLNRGHNHGHGHGHNHDFVPQCSSSRDDPGLYSDASSYNNESGSEYDYEPTATHITCDLFQVPILVRKAQEADERDEVSRANGQSSDRHAPTLKDGQNELLHCIGKLLLTRIKEAWILQLVRAQTDELLVWLTLSCMRTNVQLAMQSDAGNEALRLLLEEEDREREAANKKRGNNQRKKAKKKAKKAAKKKGGTEDKPAEAARPGPAQAKPPQPLPNATKAGAGAGAKAKAKAAATATAASEPDLSPAAGHGWSEDSEARLLAQLCDQLGDMSTHPPSAQPSNASTSPGAAGADGEPSAVEFGGASSFLSAQGPSMEDDLAEDEEALTDEEIREAQKQLKAMMANSSRAQLRANLREKFDNLCLKTT